jgi:hypothetical protein
MGSSERVGVRRVRRHRPDAAWCAGEDPAVVGRKAGRQGIARGGALPATFLADVRLACLIALACGTVGCATPARHVAPADRDAAALAARLATPPPRGSPRAIVVRLAFATEVDLDLYVTDPLEETVYFANTPSRIGGRLLRDWRCDGAGPRIETVVIDPAPPGRYRIGVDFPERCDGSGDDAAFALRVDGSEGTGGTLTRSGRISPGVFEPIVVEIVHRPSD